MAVRSQLLKGVLDGMSAGLDKNKISIQYDIDPIGSF